MNSKGQFMFGHRFGEIQLYKPKKDSIHNDSGQVVSDKRAREYHAAATRRSRKKRKDQEVAQRTRETILETHIEYLKEEFKELQHFHSSLISGENRDEVGQLDAAELVSENLMFRQNVLFHRQKTRQLSNFLNSYLFTEKMIDQTTILHINKYFMLRKLIKLSTATAQKKLKVANFDFNQVFSLPEQRYIMFCFQQYFPNEANGIQHFWSDRIANIKDSLKTELRFDISGSSNCRERWFRYDIYDIPISKQRMVEHWNKIDNLPFFMKISKSFGGNIGGKDPASKRLGFRPIGSVSEVGAPEDKFGGKIAQLPPYQFFAMRNDDNAKATPNSFSLKVRDRCFVRNENFPTNEFSNPAVDQQETDLFACSLIHHPQQKLEKLENRGTTGFRGVMFRQGSDPGKTHVTVIDRFNLGAIDYAEMLRTRKYMSADLIEEVKRLASMEEATLLKFVKSTFYPKTLLMRSQLCLLLSLCFELGN